MYRAGFLKYPGGLGERDTTPPQRPHSRRPLDRREGPHRCRTYLTHGAHSSTHTPHHTGPPRTPKGIRRSIVRVTARAADGLPLRVARLPDMPRTRACEMVALGALPEQLQPLTSFAPQRRGEPARSERLKEAAAGERERISCRQVFHRACRGMARSVKYVRTDGVEVAQ